LRVGPTALKLRCDLINMPPLAYSMEILLHEPCARLLLQELHLLLELERSNLCLAAHWVLLPCDCMTFQLLLHAVEVLFKLELIELPLRFGQLLHAWRCSQTGMPDCLLPTLVELPLREIEFLSAMAILKVYAPVECVDLLLLRCVCPRVSALVSRRPAGGRHQKKSGQQQTDSRGPAQLHWWTSCALCTPSRTIRSSSVQGHGAAYR